jgi:hypothetical protein
VIANDRTLEQKIADAGPTNQRIEPIALTQARKEMQEAGQLGVEKWEKTFWYHLAETKKSEWKRGWRCWNQYMRERKWEISR